MNTATQPWPVTPGDIPVGYCYPPMELNALVNGNRVSFNWKNPHPNDGVYLNYWEEGESPTQVLAFGSNYTLILEPFTAYKWSLRLMCNRIADTGSIVVYGNDVVTGDVLQDCSVIDTSTSSVIISGNTVRIDWPHSGGVDYYNFELTTGNGYSRIMSIGENFVVINNLIVGVNYGWRVSPVCAQSEPSIKRFFVIQAVNVHKSLALQAKVHKTTALLFWKNDAKVMGLKVYLNNKLVREIWYPTTMVSLNKLIPNQTYLIGIEPIYAEGVGNISFINIKTEADTVNPPTNLMLSEQDGNMLITWTPAENISGQMLYSNGTSLELSSTYTSYTIPITPDTIYYIKIESMNEGNTSEPAIATIKTSAHVQLPNGFTAYTSYNQSLLRWFHSTGAVKYRIRYKAGAGAWSLPIETQKTFYMLNGLVPNTDYTIELVGVGNNNSISNAVQLPIKTILAPSGQLPSYINIESIRDTSFAVLLGIPLTELNSNYRIDVTSPTNVVTSFVPDTNGLTVITGLTPATIYTFKVFNVFNPSQIAESIAYGVTTLKTCVAPQNLNAAFSGANLVVTWDVVNDGNTYELYLQAVNGGAITPIDIVTPGNVSIAALPRGVYNIMVVNKYATPLVYDSAGSCYTTVISTIPVVENVGVDATTSTVFIHWDEIKGVYYYQVDISSIGEEMIRTSFTTSLELSLTELTNYSVTVSAIQYGAIPGVPSTPVVFKTGCVPPVQDDCIKPEFTAVLQDSHINTPTITTGTSVDLMVEITGYDSATRYMIDIYNSTAEVPIAGKLFSSEDESLTGKWIFPNLPPGTYIAKVTSYAGLNKYCSDSKTVVTGFPAPTGLVFSGITHDTIVATWTPPTAREPIAYEIYSGNTLLGEVTCGTYTLTGLTPSTLYTIKVRSKFGEFGYSSYTTDTATTAAAPLS